ncbi:uncharacterized protein ATNIH1004_007762 [Aspergillus tanneri]|uniref:Uncharacterized protein n=1 Tax=Aspergillus tanneri TaxID=1220188 RepID=A0A5M9MH70_9EURO|nr:uncharacterized protein ATNIH1004_007762 [Aspergillus tanneri]KAA8646335.1 hypothetical protein ATNIH1004_007762 [Aspergillus tanneri]
MLYMSSPGAECRGYCRLKSFLSAAAEKARHWPLPAIGFSILSSVWFHQTLSPASMGTLRCYCGILPLLRPLVHFCHVETSNHTLEEIAVAFGDKAFDNDEDVMEAADAKNES